MYLVKLLQVSLKCLQVSPGQDIHSPSFCHIAQHMDFFYVSKSISHYINTTTTSIAVLHCQLRMII